MKEDGIAADLLAAGGGDRGAFRRLYITTAPKLLGVARRMTGDAALAEEALQDAYIDIWRRAGDYDPKRGRAVAWMAVIVRNRAIDLLRKRGRRQEVGGIEAEDGIGALIADPAQAADGGAMGLALRACLERLDARMREAVTLAYCWGLTREELAVRYAVPANTTKTWLRRALQSLRACLDE